MKRKGNLKTARKVLGRLDLISPCAVRHVREQFHMPSFFFVSSACALCIGGGLAMSVSSPPSFGEEGSFAHGHIEQSIERGKEREEGMYVVEKYGAKIE